MNTAEMWLEAQKTGKVYDNIDGDMAYSAKMGLTDKYDFNDKWALSAFDDLNQLMECEWQEMDNVMTIDEAEARFGIKILRR